MHPTSNLTTAWNVNAAYEHFWNARWRTSLYGGYAAVSYSDRGNANALCRRGPRWLRRGTGAIAAAGCDSDWQTWWLGSRTQWNVTKDFYLGLDVMYARLSGLSVPAGTRWGSAAPRRLPPTWTTGSSASACTAISIPDRVAAV